MTEAIQVPELQVVRSNGFSGNGWLRVSLTRDARSRESCP
jgi:hypothetical protein